MKNFDQYPKSIKKAVRYIKQDATKEQLEEIRKLIEYAIKEKKLEFGISIIKQRGESMTYSQRLSLFIFVDSCIVLTVIFFSRFLVNATTDVITIPIIASSLALILSHHFFSLRYKLYKKAWEYASIGELFIIFKVVTLSILVAAIVQQIVVGEIFFRLLAVTWSLHLLLIGGSRFCWRLIRDSFIIKSSNKKRTLIIGAGSAGTMIARQLLKNQDADILPVGFIDDDPRKLNLDILGIPVVGSLYDIEEKVNELQIENIIIAIPSLKKKELNQIFQECAKTTAKTQILPMLEDIVTGKLSVSHFRDVQVEDLLGREQVKLDTEGIADYVTDKVVLVTGAGGSIGSEICRQIANFHPSKLILLGHGENSIYTIEMELKEKYKNAGIQFITEIADLQNAEKMTLVMGTYHPDVVYHAAAHKHVPLMERNPEEAVKNNIIGTMNAAKAASWNGVGTFVMISTDKAVNPTSVMGSTKRLAEMIVQNMGKTSKTKFVAVRFGNVLGSRGSVIPLFKKQIEKGGPVTVTHPDMVRYFMTIPEASRLVIQAGALARGGEIFVLDMGEPVKIVDLAKNLIRLSGNSIEEIGIEFSGIRPGEKLFEELLKPDEMNNKQVYPKIYIGKTSELYIEEINEIISTYMLLEKEALREKLLNLANHRVALQPEPGDVNYMIGVFKMKVRKAIIPAAGLGTRFLPATKAMPKEMLPIVDKPTIQYIVEEAIESGIEDIIIVTGKGKRSIEDHFDHSFELEQNLFEKGKFELLEEVQKSSKLVDIHYIRQKEPKGLGHAIWCARKFIGNEPFAVLLGDDIVQAEKPCLKQMIEQYERFNGSILGAQMVSDDEVSRYGIIGGNQIGERFYSVSSLVEKPKKEDAPSNLAIMGRYILNPMIFDILSTQTPGAGGEIQLTDAIAALNEHEAVYAYDFEGIRYDVGEKFGFIQTTIEFALQREDLRNKLLDYLSSVVDKELIK